MRALAPTLLLLATSTLAAPPDAAPAAVSAPAAVAAPPASKAPLAAPVAIQPARDAAPAPARAPEQVGPGAPAAVAPSSAPATPSPPARKGALVVPTQATVEKLGLGDRLYLAGDYRNALFAYQDAAYQQPRYAPARVRLGRAYLALRYPALAIAQAEAALAEDPENADARKLVEEAKNPPARAANANPPPPTMAAPAEPPPARSATRVFRFTPEPDAQAAAAPAPASSAPAERVVTVVVPAAPAAPEAQPAAARAASEPRAFQVPGAPPSADVPPSPPPAAAPPMTAAQHYRTALGHLQNREWAKAIAELSDAILADPKLAVAYTARGSAYFGLGKYRDAAEDYRGALLLDGASATPVYGLAECYRVLGDAKRAAEMYERYARSNASDVRDDLRTIAGRRAQELR